MKSFTAHIIYRIVCDEVSSEQYEEQWRIVFASDERAALVQACNIGKEEECVFVDRHGRRVRWEMVAVKELIAVHLKHGALLFSAVKEVEPIACPLWSKDYAA